MQIAGIDERDNKILALLKENARYSFSEIAEKIGISRVAVKNRIQNMEEMGLIRGYQVKIAPKRVDNSVEFVIVLEPRPTDYDYVVGRLASSSLIQKVQASTGACKIFAYGVAPNTQELDAYYKRIRKILTDVRFFSFDIIASTYKDVDGGIEYEQPGEECIEDANRADS